MVKKRLIATHFLEKTIMPVLLRRGVNPVSVSTLLPGTLIKEGNRQIFNANEVVAAAGMIISQIGDGHITFRTQAEVIAYYRNGYKTYGKFSAQ